MKDRCAHDWKRGGVDGRTWHGYQSVPLQSAIIAQQELPEQDKAGGYTTGYAPRRRPRQLGRRPPHSSCRRSTGSDGAALAGKHVARGPGCPGPGSR